MVKWRTSVAMLPRIRYAASSVVAVVLSLVYHSLFPFFFSRNQNRTQGSSFFRFDLFNMLLTDMDVGETVLGEETDGLEV